MAQAQARRNALKEVRRKFWAALAWREMTMEAYAQTVGVVPYHLSQVLKGKRTSGRLIGLVLEFIAEFEREVCEQAGRSAPEAKVA